MKTTSWLLLLGGALLLGLPMAGIWLAGLPVERYLEFPPTTHYIDPAPFSWTGFILLGLFEVLLYLPLWLALVTALRRPAPARHRFPWWGYAGLAGGAVAWWLAWTRYPWFSEWQDFTFTPLWIAYIVVINALTWRRGGRCMMTHEPVYFFSLFPLSALFWWFFEYLNRFVQNWFYLGVEAHHAWHYFWMATLPFSTVLPAVLGTEEWLAGWGYGERFRQARPLNAGRSRVLAMIVLVTGATGLFLTGIHPQVLFPLLWIAPLAFLAALRTLGGDATLFESVRTGDWSRIVRLAFAALICGFFWEMWNYHSLARWIYSVPYVYRYLLFEMPLLGFAGYLPFGLECGLAGELLRRRRMKGEV